jgi:LysR family transcriptional regulator, hydrogen peroxide-inducible genes activator
MNISWITLRDLEYLTAVARFQHFGKAAAFCNVSQPALSAQIKKIEDFLGVLVFERSNRRVSITEVGEAVVTQAAAVLEEAEKIIQIVRDQRQPLTGAFRLGAIATLGPYYFPHILSPLKQTFSKLDLKLREGLTNGLLEELRNGALDAILAARTFPEGGLTVIPLFKEPFVLLFPKKHPLLAKSAIEAKDLKAEEMVLLEDGHCLRDQIVDICPANRRGNIQQFHATSLETIRYLVGNDVGYTLLPLFAARDNEMLKDLTRFRVLEGKTISREIVLVCRERFARKKDVERLAEFLRKNIPRFTLLGQRAQPIS